MATGVTLSAAATGSLQSALSSAQNAASQGQSLYEQASAASSGQGLAGLGGIAMGLASDLPAGQIKSIVSSIAALGENAGSGAAMGATIGSIFPGLGTAAGAAVGAVVGAVVSVIENVTGSNTVPPQGEFRSKSEQYVFPAVPLSSAKQQPLALPACWPDIRLKSTQYQEIDAHGGAGTDPASGANGVAAFTFGTGWISPPGSTPASQQAAWDLANAWMGQNPVTKAFALATKPPAGVNRTVSIQSVKSNADSAAHDMQSSDNFKAAVALFNRWYGSKFTPGLGLSSTGITNTSGNVMLSATDKSYVSKLVGTIDKINAAYPNDFTYYVSNDHVLLDLNGPNQIVGIPYAPILGKVASHVTLLSLPDTLAISLFELAAIVTNPNLAATGSVPIPPYAADLVAFQMVMGMAWSWAEGRKWDDDKGNVSAPKYHPNIMRVLGIVKHYVKISQSAVASAQTAAAKQTATVAAAAVQTQAQATAQAVAQVLRQQPVVLPPVQSTAALTSALSSSIGEDVALATFALIAAGGAIWFFSKRA